MHSVLAFATLPAMKLRKYLNDAPRGERSRLAEAVQTSPAYLSQIASGWRLAGAELSARIERETAGWVRAEELRPDIDWSLIRGRQRARGSRQ